MLRNPRKRKVTKPAWPDSKYPGTHGYENTAWFFSTVLCIFTVKMQSTQILDVLQIRRDSGNDLISLI
ncbi:MAG: hypothetical protein DRH37_06035 [Deltaproteobacteria bacterium]|nr:MAG: hypothetical protein DRH37_06035 [Deltaproteobacteria bacterium]